LCTLGDVSVTTRVDGEATARIYDLDHHGNITASCSSLTETDVREKAVAGQRGTIVSVRHLFSEFFVRLTYARKHRVTVAKVKSIILTYAFVRDVRFTLQFRGNKRIDWTVQPSRDAMSVAKEVLGREIMQRYQNVSWTDGGLTIDGILPRANEGLNLR